MTLLQIKEILSFIKYKDWNFIADQIDETHFFIQAVWLDVDHDTNKVARIKGRKFLISQYAIPDEIVKTCWLAVELGLRHEAMEEFKVNGEAPFHPHNDVFSLVNIPKVHRTEIVPEVI